MRTLEETLLARVMHEGSAQKAIARGVHEGWFDDPIVRQAWVEIVNHASKPATRNETPSIRRLEKRVHGLRVLNDCPEETPKKRLLHGHLYRCVRVIVLEQPLCR